MNASLSGSQVVRLPCVDLVVDPADFCSMYHSRLSWFRVYHWQPGPDFQGPNQPHLHVSAALHARINAVTARHFDLDKRHLTTGHVSLEMMVRMLIEEFGILPIRADWQQVLERAGQITTTG